MVKHPGRKPVHLVAAARHPGSRQAMWEAMRRLRRFTVTSITNETNAVRDTARTFVESLARGGFLAAVGTTEPVDRMFFKPGSGQKVPTVYELVQDIGVEAPRVRRDGSLCTQGLPREQMWRTMKLLAEFTPRELAVAASTEAHPVADEDARDYVKHLLRADYLRIIVPATKRRQARYRLVRNTGPKPPMVQRLKSVFDPNLRQIVWHDEPAE